MRYDRLGQRLVRLFAGLVLYGVGIGLLVRSNLGLDPWNVLRQGLSPRTRTSNGRGRTCTATAVWPTRCSCWPKD